MSTSRLLYDFGLQILRFGPVLNARMAIMSASRLPWGLSAAGAETVKVAVDAGSSEGVARLTSALVRLGWLSLARDIVVALCAQGRWDVVAAVSRGLMQLPDMCSLSRVTRSLVEAGHTRDVLGISHELVSQGHTEIVSVIRDAGVDMGLWTGGEGGVGDEDDDEAAAPAGDAHSGGASSKLPASTPASHAHSAIKHVKQSTAKVVQKVTQTLSGPEKSGPQDVETASADQSKALTGKEQ